MKSLPQESAIDIVYILGSGSQWNNYEICLSLRSVAKNLTGIGKIFVVGENPGFLAPEVIHLPYPDQIQSSQNADGNMALKILHACEDSRLSDDFLFMNDDFIINKPVNVHNIPLMHKGDMRDRPDSFWKSQFYRYRLRRTFDILQERCLPTLQYDYHAPMMMNKKLFPEVMKQYNFLDDIGYTFRSLYGNTLGLPAVHLENQKITFYKSYSHREVIERTVAPLFIGYNDQGLSPAFKFWLFTTFPDCCKYESEHHINDRYYDLANWYRKGKPYDDGVKIWLKYHPYNNLSRLFQHYHTEALETKLNFKLTQQIVAL